MAINLQHLKNRLLKNGRDESTGGEKTDAAVPGGIQLRADDIRVAGLSRRLIVAVAVLAAAAIFAVWYGLTHVKPTMRVESSSGFAPASADYILPPKPYQPQPVKPAPAAVASSASAVAAPIKTKTAAAGSGSAPVTPSQPTPQVQAVTQALAGGSLGRSWSSSGPGAHPKATPAAVDQLPPEQPAPTTITEQPAPTAINPVNSQSGLGVYDTHLVRKPASPFELMQGSVIPATLTTGIESDLPGQITAVVARNVFDSASGANLLIPAGAQLVGTYAAKVLPGQSSVAVAWTRIVFPNGSYINLGAMPGTDPDGMSGISGDVDNHTWLMFKNALLLSLVGTGIQAATPQTTSVNGSLSTAQIFQSQLANTFGQAVSQMLQRYMSVAPTIHVQPGAQIAVVVSKDLVFPGPYTSAMQASPQSPRDTAPPAMLNPYPTLPQR